MVAGQEHEEWLFAQELELQALRLFVRPEKRHVDFSTKQRLSELRRRGAVNDKLCFVQLIAQNSQDFREPFDFITGQEAHDESGLGGSGGPPRRLGRRFDLRQYQRVWPRKTRPAAVSSMPRGPRIIHWTSSFDSRSRICRLSEGCAVWSRFSAAWVKLPSSATATK